MIIEFTKYQATGNDFILIDNRSGAYSLSIQQIVKLCHRQFGIGADGLILIEKSAYANFKVNYYNSDGSQSLCGNGSRAAVCFARQLQLIQSQTSFEGYDGIHQAQILANNEVQLKMNDVPEAYIHGSDFFINTGSPHIVSFVENLKKFPVTEQGKIIRYSDAFKPEGTNVNFVELLGDNTIFVRTYERGVENETLSCGTGVTAAALMASERGYNSPIKIQTPGGNLSVSFKNTSAKIFTDVYLTGPAESVFEGRININT